MVYGPLNNELREANVVKMAQERAMDLDGAPFLFASNSAHMKQANFGRKSNNFRVL